MARQERQLHLRLCSDFHCTTETNRLLLKGITDRAKAGGHKLTIQPLVKEERKRAELMDYGVRADHILAWGKGENEHPVCRSYGTGAGRISRAPFYSVPDRA